jgi:hypothetical protein
MGCPQRPVRFARVPFEGWPSGLAYFEQNVAYARSDFRSCVDFIPINLVHTVTLGYGLVAPNKAIRDGDRKT